MTFLQVVTAVALFAVAIWQGGVIDVIKTTSVEFAIHLVITVGSRV